MSTHQTASVNGPAWPAFPLPYITISKSVASLTIQTPADFVGAMKLPMSMTWTDAQGQSHARAVLNNVEAYDTTSNSWRALAPMPTARHGIQAAMFAGSAYIAGGGTKMGGGGATDIHEVFALDGTPPGPALPDCRVKLMGDSSLIGNNVYGTTGANQTRSTTAAASMTRTFVFSMQNDSSVSNTITVQGPAAMPGFTVRYLAGLSGTTDITSRVVAGTYTTTVVPPGGVRSLRLLITASPGTATGTSGTWLVQAAAGASPAVVDACAAMLTVG